MGTNQTSQCNCGESCGQSCGDSCSESCNQSCNQACNQACNNFCNSFCQNACACGSTTTTSEIYPLFVTSVSVGVINIVYGLINGFNSKTPLFLTLIGSIILAISLTGFRGYQRNKLSNKYERNSYILIFNRFLFLHSHHCQDDILKGKEFKIKSRYYCTGCYGLFLGTVISLIGVSIYLVFQNVNLPIELIVPIIPLFFVPIILRYTIIRNMNSTIRFLSNALLPIGCFLLFIASDVIFNDWLINSFLVIFTLLVALLRGYISVKN
ncbi:MAG: hypothetical protein ACW967_05495 [Candidatus Hodarchaeales archaeon]|jgi:hypothetical protein